MEQIFWLKPSFHRYRNLSWSGLAVSSSPQKSFYYKHLNAELLLFEFNFLVHGLRPTVGVITGQKEEFFAEIETVVLHIVYVKNDITSVDFESRTIQAGNVDACS